MRKPVSSVFQNRPLAPSPFRPLSFPALPCRKFFLPFPPKFKCPKNRREGQEEFAAREGGEAERAKRRGGERAILLSRCCNVDHRRQLPNGAYRDSPGRPLARSPPLTSTSLVGCWRRGAYGFHLILQPTLGRCCGFTGSPPNTASIAARRSAPVTGTSFRGRALSNCPR